MDKKMRGHKCTHCSEHQELAHHALHCEECLGYLSTPVHHSKGEEMMKNLGI